MSSAARGKRARSRKRRPRSSGATATVAAPAAAPEAGSSHRRRADSTRDERDRARRRQGTPRQSPTARAYGQRPKSPWHPLPISELLILAGMVGVVIGLRRGTLSAAGPPLLVGLIAVALGTFEVSLREHRSGYRSHKIMLAALPVLIFHSGVVLCVSLVTKFPPLANVVLLAVDFAIFALLFRLFRSSFLDARAQRVAGRR